MLETMFSDYTGRAGIAGVRYGFADCDSFLLGGFVARDTWTGCIDAPDYMPQGSVQARYTIKHVPRLTIANRDALAGMCPIGASHDN